MCVCWITALKGLQLELAARRARLIEAAARQLSVCCGWRGVNHTSVRSSRMITVSAVYPHHHQHHHLPPHTQTPASPVGFSFICLACAATHAPGRLQTCPCRKIKGGRSLIIREVGALLFLIIRLLLLISQEWSYSKFPAVGCWQRWREINTVG